MPKRSAEHMHLVVTLLTVPGLWPARPAILSAAAAHTPAPSCPLPPAAGSRSQDADLDPSKHEQGRWMLEVLRGLGLAGPGAWAAEAPPVHIGVSFGAASVLDLAAVAPDTIRAAALVVPGGLMPGQWRRRRQGLGIWGLGGRGGMHGCAVRAAARHAHSGSHRPALALQCPSPAGDTWAIMLKLVLPSLLYRLLPCAWTARLALSGMCDEPQGELDFVLANWK